LLASFVAMASSRCAEALLLGALFGISAGRPLKLSAKLGAATLFPDAESPYAGDAPLPIFGEKCAEVSVIKEAQLTGYNQVATGLFVPPACTDWSQVVLRFDGAVRGVQFDRFGAVWLAGVEVLRLTTPEPTAKGIRWQALRDITALGPILRASGNMSLEIPNVVNPTYTGILKINITLEFYKLAGGRVGSTSKIVRPLRNWTTPSIFATGVNGNQTQTNLLSNLPRNMMQATLEVFASGHGCEEFWYSNLPDEFTPKGGCGGGAYREIEVFVDGMTAGVAYPFPVIYTGGVNPLLWRPLTGIASFDIPPYNIDLSPFLGVLNDGKTHNISLTVRNNNNNGVWYLDPVLHAELDPSATVLTGALLQHTDTKPAIVVKWTNHGNVKSHISTQGKREVKVLGSLLNPKTKASWNFQVDYSLSAFVDNNPIGANLQVTDGWMRSTSTSTKFDGKMTPLETIMQKSWFPYYVYDKSAEDKTTFEIGPTKVTYRRETTLSLQVGNAPWYPLYVSRNIGATALYNRSLSNHSLVNKQQGTSVENSDLATGTKPRSCFSSELSAKNGFTTSQRNTSVTCDWQSTPMGFYVCGLAFCKQSDGIARSARSYLTRSTAGNGWGSESVSEVDAFVV